MDSRLGTKTRTESSENYVWLIALYHYPTWFWSFWSLWLFLLFFASVVIGELKTIVAGQASDFISHVDLTIIYRFLKKNEKL